MRSVEVERSEVVEDLVGCERERGSHRVVCLQQEPRAQKRKRQECSEQTTTEGAGKAVAANWLLHPRAEVRMT